MGLMSTVRTWAGDIAGMIWPRTCAVCGSTLVDGEKLLCLHCLMAMPLTWLHRSDFNSIHQRMGTDVRIERAGAMMTYTRAGLYSAIIRNGKYNSRPDLLRALAAIYARQLCEDRFFDGIDMIIPVPMHVVKRLRRGYNQSAVITSTLSRESGIPMADNLKASKSHATQTRRTAHERYLNVAGLFSVISPAELAGKHVLLVDDVITSGATLHACALALTQATGGNITISIATLASTSA